MKKKLLTKWLGYLNYPCCKIFLKMRFTLYLILLFIIQTSASNGYSQVTKLSLNLKNITVNEALNAIEQQTQYFFLFNNKLIDVNRKIDVHYQNADIENVLNGLFEGTDVKYIIKDRQIILTNQLKQDASQQTKNVTGKVTDSSGQSLPGVTVVIKGTTNGTITDSRGKYSLSNVPEDATLVFSFVGMKTQEISVSGKATIDVILLEDAIGIEEVVAIGYGTMRKENLTGAVASVNSEDLVAVPVLGFDQALQGRASGVYVSNTQSNPGGEVQVRIRGVNSIQGNNDPLYVIDGLVDGDISAVDPTDIESIDILKDASSTAIYGTRGANGVIIVTTKSGKAGTNQFSFDMYYGLQKLIKKLDLMNAQEHATWVNTLNEIREEPPTYSNVNNLPYDTDWQDAVYDIAPMVNYSLSARGGTEKLKYYISGNYIDVEGIALNTAYNRYNLRINVDSDVNDRLSVGARVGFSRAFRTDQFGEDYGGGSNSFHSVIVALQLSPTQSPYDENGNLVPDLQLVGDGDYRSNPLQYQQEVTAERYNYIINTNLFADYEILDGLKFRSSFGFNYNGSKRVRYKPSITYDTNNGFRSYAYIGDGLFMGWINENYFSFKKKFGVHNLELLGGFTAQYSKYQSLTAEAWDFAVDEFEYNNIAAGDNASNSMSSNMNERSLASFYGRIHYEYNNKYLITLNGRYDGSSKFGVNNNWGFFPSGAIAWRLSEEPFIQELNLFSNLKLRGSYGISGSDALGAYESLSAMSPLQAYILNGSVVNGYSPTRLPNPDLRWEKTTQLDAGLDIGFYNGRLNFVLDYYNKVTDDLFLDKPVPMTTGLGTVKENIGSLKNNGFEVGIDAVPFDGKFKWNVGFNMSYQNSEVLELVGDDEEIIVGEISGSIKLGYMQIIKVGEKIGSFYGYRTDGIWQEDDPELETAEQFGSPVYPGLRKFVDLDGDGDINDQDRDIIGNAYPAFFGGLNNTFSYKGFDASVFMQYSIDNNVLNAVKVQTTSVSSNRNKLKDLIGNTWTPENPDAKYPAMNSSEPALVTDYLIEDASFLRIREITFGYSFPESVLNKLRVDRLRIYLTGSNLFTFTNYSGYDPEVNIYGGGDFENINTDNGSYPRAKSITVGVNLTF